MSELTYKIRDHSGDLSLEACGSTLLEAIANASLGLVNEVVPLDRIHAQEQIQLAVRGEDTDSRVIAFLNEIVFIMFTKSWLPCSVKYMTMCGSKGCEELQAVLAGESLDPARHEPKYDVKAVTYHDFSITETAGKVTIRFVCDL